MSMKEVAPGVYLGKHSVVKFSSLSDTGEAQPTEITLKTENAETVGKFKFAPWGESNTEPQNILKQIGDIGVAGRGILTNVYAHYGTGLNLYEEDELGNKQKVGYKKYPAFVEFDKINYANQIALEFIHDFECFSMGFVEFVLSRDFNRVNRMKRQPASFCRFEVMNEKSGRIQNVAINANWSSPDHNFTQVVPCFSMYDYFDDIKAYCKKKKIYKFIIPFFAPRLGEVYYNKPFWTAPLKNGWADVVLSVPAVKNAIAKNQTHFKYLIHVSEKYFQISNGTDKHNGYVWDSFSAKEKIEKKRELIDALDAHMSGVEAGGRSLTVPMIPGMDGKPEETIKIVPIDDKLKDGAYLPDASAANTEILFALGVDPSIVGIGIPGSSNLSGSGSDKREAYTILCANKMADRTISTLPFYFVRDWNGWGDDLDFGFPNVNLTTLDKNKDGQEEIHN